MKIDDDVFDFRFLALLIAFAVGVPLDWFFNRPSEAHWLAVSGAFVLLVVLHYVDNIQTRLTQVEGKLEAILRKLNEPV